MSRQDPSSWDENYVSGDFREKWHREHPSRELVTVVAAAMVPSGAHVLDIGCGAGTETIYLAIHGYRAIGVDFSPEAIKVARQRAQEADVTVDWRVGDALDLPIEDGAIDFAFDRGCFHHVPEEDRPRYAEQVARVLRPGGRLFLRGFDPAGDPDSPFVPVTEEAIDRAFSRERFARGPVEVFEPADEEDPRIFMGVFLTRL
jgi:SAM-dependent methyltransferase